MKTKTIFAVGMLSLFAVYGCSASDAEDTEPDQSESEDELNLGKGNVDNAGVVELTTMMLTGPTIAPPLDQNLDPYNQADPFKIGAGPYRAVFAVNLAKFDGEAGKMEWTADQAGPWVGRLAAGNYQVIDTSKPCQYDAPHTYLEIERAQLTGKSHKTCGGRMPNEDAMDVTLNFLIRGPAAASEGQGAITDGVEQATKQSGKTFPYLAEMNGF
jgi:hypothetical protein